MPSKSNGPVVTFLMFVPLLAIPVLAVFGVPQLPKRNSAPDDAAYSDLDSDLGSATSSDPFAQDSFSNDRSFAGSAPAEIRPINWDDRQALRNEVADNSYAASGNTPSQWNPPPDSLNGWSLENRPNGTESAPSTEPPANQPDASEPEFNSAEVAETEDAPAETTGEQPITWQAAVSRLKELGIHRYQLQPGSEQDRFHFSCFFSNEDNARIAHRFEAEASDPLLAVQDVVGQVEHWLTQQ